MKPAYKQYLCDLQDGLCWLCHEPLDLSIPWPHPRAVTGDHLIPRSKGGRGKHNNKLLAHNECNERRAAGDPVSIHSALLLLRRKDDLTAGDL